MNILLCGARGFIGRHIAQALRAQGHHVIAGQSAPAPHGPTADACAMDFSTDLTPRHWLPRLAGVDAVVNAVGLLRPTRHRSLQAVHTQAPCALMNACAEAGVPRVLHLSALGIEGSPTDYAQTKLAADVHALALHASGRLQVTVLRPSIVFGAGGASSALFSALAHSPLLGLPRPVMRARVQPVAVQDLADAVAQLVAAPSPTPALVNAVGPQALTLAEFIGSLRQQLGKAPARILPLPDTLTRWSARLGDAIPGLPWCSATLSLLAQDNTADPTAFARILGRDARPHGLLLQANPHWSPRHA
jgi:nucleoside-diphosphate-sugar epimerase